MVLGYCALSLQVGIFDADVYGPSIPMMVSPEKKILEMNEETKVGFLSASCVVSQRYQSDDDE